MHPENISIKDYSYDLPEERIAKYPLAERDASKLLIYNDGAISQDIYRNISVHLPEGAIMVFNQTKVVHARLLFQKPSSGVIEVFCLAPGEQYPDIQTAMLQRGKVEWECLVGGASKWKHGMALQLTNESPHFTVSARIVARNPSAYILSLEWDNDELTFAEVLHHTGKVPLPPYLHRNAETMDDMRYQTVFAREDGSVAAPTAGLHFTSEIMHTLADKKIETEFVTLHVGAGTFKPVKSATMAGHDMHAEWIEVNRQVIVQIAENERSSIIAVGTTSLRALESIYWIGNQLLNGHEPPLHGIAVGQWTPYGATTQHTRTKALRALLDYMAAHNLKKIITRTQILIAPGYNFKMADGLVTNFHQPQSTLLLLVSAFIGGDWRRTYDYALANGFRFLSYGDGSLLWRR